MPLKRAVSPSRLGPTQPLLSGSVLTAKKGADAALLVGLLLPVPHVMGARGLPRPDASAQTLSLSWPFLPNLA